MGRMVTIGLGHPTPAPWIPSGDRPSLWEGGGGVCFSDLVFLTGIFVSWSWMTVSWFHAWTERIWKNGAMNFKTQTWEKHTPWFLLTYPFWGRILDHFVDDELMITPAHPTWALGRIFFFASQLWPCIRIPMMKWSDLKNGMPRSSPVPSVIQQKRESKPSIASAWDIYMLRYSDGNAQHKWNKQFSLNDGLNTKALFELHQTHLVLGGDNFLAAPYWSFQLPLLSALYADSWVLHGGVDLQSTTRNAMIDSSGFAEVPWQPQNEAARPLIVCQGFSEMEEFYNNGPR